ncbi:MAG TPA: hypothetical protein VJ756_13605 [Terriglobales bacterium]|nr:hypothetical protein [Terriglobales bacterium]
MPKWPYRLIQGLFLVVLVTTLLAFRFLGNGEVAVAQQAPPLVISPNPPTELNGTGGGPSQATLQQAAEFAWEEFFALNWPAGPQSGQPGQRDTPSSTCAFGDQSPSCAGPLVWETFRNKVEIFPGTGNPPGYPTMLPSPIPPGYAYGYDALPQYNYSTYSPVVGACSNPSPSSDTSPSSPVWVNLDETDQITLDSMYAGVVSAKPSASNSAPKLIRFLAKANRAEYIYIASHHWFDGSAPTGATAAYVKNHMQDPTDPDQYVVLPSGSIEVKAGWRVLNPSEKASGRFHTATVRYYEKNSAGAICYQQDTFGLVSLHIIQKTPMAPYFIYATFEQADNILDANGRPVEDVDGSPLPPAQRTACANGGPDRTATACAAPTTPSVTLNDTTTVSPTFVPPQVSRVPSTAAYCTSDVKITPPNQLYYLNSSNKPGLPTGGYICVNNRANSIPPSIVDTNKSAHALIQSYSSAHGVTNSVWQYYKLINVQYQPVNKGHASPYGTQPGETDFLSAHNPSTYYLANIVVETNRPLQLFSGGLVQSGSTGSNSDYAVQYGGTGLIHSDMFYQGSGYNMGGCMGCHGLQGQVQGGDFSVIVAEGPVATAETPAPPTRRGAAVIPRNRSLKK